MRVHNFIGGVIGMTLLSAGFALLGGCDQPKPNCIASAAAFAAKLIERERAESEPGACDGFNLDRFNLNPRLGLGSYYAQNAKKQPDYDKGSVAIQTSEFGRLSRTAAMFDIENSADGGELFAFGAFSAGEPDDDNICAVPRLSSAHLVLAEIPAVADDPATPDDDESFPGQPAIDIELRWSSVRVYVTPASFGTQVQGDLTDIRRTPEGATCTIGYRVLGLAPAVSCQKVDMDSGELLTNDDGTPQLDPALCDPEADPSEGRFEGSGISPDTRYTCDPVSAFCVLVGQTVPAIR